MTVWFTSDLHFAHPTVACRRFGAAPDRERWDLAAKHDERVLDVINSHVGRNDVLYVLGDLSSGSRRSVEQAAGRVAMLNPPVKRRRLVLGNHDDVASCAAFPTLIHPLFIEVAREARITTPGPDGREVTLILSHYPWRNLMDGRGGVDVSSNAYDGMLAPYAPPYDDRAWLLHGHTHAKTTVDPAEPMAIHVGWDAWHRPVALEEILTLIRERS